MVKANEIDYSKTYWFWELQLSGNYRAYKKTVVCEVKIVKQNHGQYYLEDMKGKRVYSGYIHSNMEHVYCLYETQEEAIDAWNEHVTKYLNTLTSWYENKADYLKRTMIQSPVKKKIKRGTSENP